MGVKVPLRPEYRADIDGLRTVAVLAVIVTHAFPLSLPGGFIGVDIFFVISGFLISTLIVESLDRNDFSFSDFYARRVRRIFPALAVVLAFTIGVGWYVLLPNEYEFLARHVVSATAFVPNFILWSEAGYFDIFAGRKLLLHLWSLGVEEQFYFLWPLILWLSPKIKIPRQTAVVGLIAVSFLLNLRGIARDPIATFFSPQTRLWELACGGWLALFSYRRVLPSRSWVACVGGLFLAFGFWQIDSGMKFPGALALFPVIGTILIISAGSDAWFNRFVLSNRVAVGVGLISYPLYLWHWPLLVFARIIEGQTPTAVIRWVAVLASFPFAWMTYRWIELPFRFGSRGRLKVAALIGSMISLCLAGIQIRARAGFPEREFAKNNAGLHTGYVGGLGSIKLESNCGLEDPSIQKEIEVCARDLRGTPRYALLGDSKASVLFPGLIRTSLPGRYWMAIAGNWGPGPVLPLLTMEPFYENTQRRSWAAMEAVLKNPSIQKVVYGVSARGLFLAGKSSGLEGPEQSPFPDTHVVFDGLKASIDAFVAAGKPVVIVVDNPTLPYPEDCLHREIRIPFITTLLKQEKSECRLSLSEHRRRTQKYREVLQALEQAFPGKVKIFETSPYLCDETADLCTFSKDGHFLYSYSDHISDYAAGLIGRDLNAYLDSF